MPQKVRGEAGKLVNIRSIKIEDGGSCPVCHAHLDAATYLDGPTMPKDDDISICAYCHSWLVFTNGGKDYRRMEEHEIEALPKETLRGLMFMTKAVTQCAFTKRERSHKQ